MVRKKIWVRTTSILIVGILIFWLLYWFLNARIGPVVAEMSRARATSIATRAINNAISERVGKSIIYEKIMHTEMG
ncbi:MAG: hypothetical protein WCS44_06120, partial [Bacillota bacterium]